VAVCVGVATGVSGVGDGFGVIVAGSGTDVDVAGGCDPGSSSMGEDPLLVGVSLPWVVGVREGVASAVAGWSPGVIVVDLPAVKATLAP